MIQHTKDWNVMRLVFPHKMKVVDKQARNTRMQTELGENLLGTGDHL